MKALVPVLAVQLVLMIVMVTTNDMGLPVQYVIAAFWGAADAVIHIAVFGKHFNWPGQPLRRADHIRTSTYFTIIGLLLTNYKHANMMKSRLYKYW